MQKSFGLSMTEAELYTVTVTVSRPAIEVIYLSNFLTSMGFAPTKSMPVYEDSTTCIEQPEGNCAGNNIRGGWECSKHIDTSKHLTCKAIQNRLALMDTAAAG